MTMDDKYLLPLGIFLIIAVVGFLVVMGERAPEVEAARDARIAAEPPHLCQDGSEYKVPYGCNPRPATNSELIEEIAELKKYHTGE